MDIGNLAGTFFILVLVFAVIAYFLKKNKNEKKLCTNMLMSKILLKSNLEI